MGLDLLKNPEAAISTLTPVFFVAFAYFVLTLDRTRATSASKDDTQAGIKVVLWGLILAGVGLAAGGLETLLGYMLAGFKGGSGPIKVAIPPILVGALVVLIVTKALLSRTNGSSQHQAERYALGALAMQYGIFGILALDGVLTGLFNDAAWASNAGNLATLVVSAAVAGFSISRFGGLSGWTAPAPAPPPQHPPQGGGYPPQGGGYPPQGGYGQQGGGYPPQGGGYPPQGGGYPPQGGGYPPQGGYGR